ncbi:hypothetical protein ASPWEDRAFT_111994 [Aspergillus wentii DTO 134E9]|uniref:Short-chain dehydrogenase/reductase 3 n=1 Tax=Aspergillus wentii DTO 134E9 TaxID=1073089 RepID=A0A1L9RN55_ASPWE|nr:uncharacterized protein ASPWEDRAFT_111994 [Aspergillus wentii DTO 134E9]KAI9929304.1 hypothetical protein MW887_000771 [Aspergillus wentii]OJJ36258.1 hypothetical protein ASPWEDRAFT_111994 [Aspergillus wentii DTO 134E9]
MASINIPSNVLAAVKIFAAAGILYKLNQTLSRLALNNWVSDPWDWAREIVLITGGSSGIGEQMVHRLAEHGITVVILDLVAPQTATPDKVHFYQCDITSPEAVHAAAQQIRKDVGHPTVLVNNAGIANGKSILDEADEGTKRIFDVNSIAHFRLVREFLPHMIERNHGHVITIASMASFMTVSPGVAYSCTKAAALSFSEGLALELHYQHKANKVRTSVVHPTWVRTPLIKQALDSGKWKQYTLDAGTVADAVVAQILAGESGQICVPGTYTWLSCIRAFPNWLQQWVRNYQTELLEASV